MGLQWTVRSKCDENAYSDVFPIPSRSGGPRKCDNAYDDTWLGKKYWYDTRKAKDAEREWKDFEPPPSGARILYGVGKQRSSTAPGTCGVNKANK